MLLCQLEESLQASHLQMQDRDVAGCGGVCHLSLGRLMQMGCLEFKASLGCSTRLCLNKQTKPGQEMTGCNGRERAFGSGHLHWVAHWHRQRDFNTLLWPPGALICTHPHTETHKKIKQTNNQIWQLSRTCGGSWLGEGMGTQPSLPSLGGSPIPLLSLKLQEAGASCLALSQYLPTALQLSQTAWQL